VQSTDVGSEEYGSDSISAWLSRLCCFDFVIGIATGIDDLDIVVSPKRDAL